MFTLYELTYDYCSPEGYEERNIREPFEGSWVALQDFIAQMKSNGCYNIDACAIYSAGDEDDPDRW